MMIAFSAVDAPYTVWQVVDSRLTQALLMHIAGWPAFAVHAIVEHVDEGGPASGQLGPVSAVVFPESVVDVESAFVPLSPDVPLLEELLEHAEPAPSAAIVDAATTNANHRILNFIGFSPCGYALHPVRSASSHSIQPCENTLAHAESSLITLGKYTTSLWSDTAPHAPMQLIFTLMFGGDHGRRVSAPATCRTARCPESYNGSQRLYAVRDRRETRCDSESCPSCRSLSPRV
jgi:hypothetical protein